MRTKFAKTFAATTAVAVVALGASFASAAELTIVSWGGAYQEAQRKALFEPVAKALGIEIAEDTYGGISDVRLKVKSGAVNWDIVDTGAGGGAVLTVTVALAEAAPPAPPRSTTLQRSRPGPSSGPSR